MNQPGKMNQVAHVYLLMAANVRHLETNLVQIICPYPDLSFTVFYK